MIRPYRCAPFDVNDRALIQGAFLTGEPADVSGAIAAAVAGFRRRIEALPRGLPVIGGRPHLLVIAPGNFFDEYVIALVLQGIAEQAGRVVTVIKQGPAGPADRPASPDVEFDGAPEGPGREGGPRR